MHVAWDDNSVISLYYDDLIVIDMNINLVFFRQRVVVDVGTEYPDDDAGQQLLLYE